MPSDLSSLGLLYVWEQQCKKNTQKDVQSTRAGITKTCIEQSTCENVEHEKKKKMWLIASLNYEQLKFKHKRVADLMIKNQYAHKWPHQGPQEMFSI